MKKSSKLLVCLCIIVMLIIGGFWYYKKDTATETKNAEKNNTSSTNKEAKGENPNSRRNRVVPALVDKVTLNDVPIIINALGTVAANKQATVRVRVNGLVESINFTEGSIVKAGTVIAKIDARPFNAALLSAQGQLKKDQAQLNIARLDLQRYKKLLAENSIAGQQVDTQEALVKQLEGVVESDNANISSAKLNLSFTNVTAPISGRIGLKQVDAGNIVNTSDTNGIAIITEVQPIAATFSVPQENLTSLIERFEASKQKGGFIVIEARDRDNKTVLDTGKLIAVDNQTDSTTGSIKIKAQFSNKENKLFPGQFVNIHIILDTLKNVPTIMQSAVQRGNIGTFVYLVSADKKAVVQKITTGASLGNRIVVEQGLKEGDLIVIDGTDKLRDGVPITIANLNKDNKNKLENSTENKPHYRNSHLNNQHNNHDKNQIKNNK